MEQTLPAALDDPLFKKPLGDLALLLFSPFEKLDVTQCVGGDNAPDGADAVRRVHHFSVGVQDKVGRMKDLPALLPIGADLVGISRHLEAVSDGKGKVLLFYGFLSFVQRVDRQTDDINVFLLEGFEVSLVIG